MSVVSLWWWTAAALMVALMVLLALRALDERRLEGDAVWAKPAKFALSLAVHFATVAWVGSWISPSVMAGPVAHMVAWSSIGATAMEMGYISIQAARRQRSHFNVGTPFTLALYGTMAIGAVVITAAAGYVGLVLLFDNAGAPGPARLLGAQIGLIGGTVLTLITAFKIGGTMQRYVGTPSPTHRRMPVTGWSIEIGDRRIAHFLGTHMMQAMPLAGMAADALLPSGWAETVVVVTSALNIALVVHSYRSAEAGRTPWRGMTSGFTIGLNPHRPLLRGKSPSP